MELYIHIPFCIRKCRYCDFASFAGAQDSMKSYIECVLKEADLSLAQLGHHTSIETVYIGGGTPSILPVPLLTELLEGIHVKFQIAADAEWTIEANPGTVTLEWLRTARCFGINRLSIGMQAAQSELLHMLGRIHEFSDVQKSAELARQAGFENFSLDLMFGLPGQTLSQWEETLLTALSLSPKHLSCYGLIPEDGTPLKKDLDEHVLTLPEEEMERQMYDLAINKLHDSGFKQYEISNFALPGYACRHNIGYWNQTYYLGLGVSAASMLPCKEAAYLRRTNPDTLPTYQSMIRNAELAQNELITHEEAMFETLMLGLRMTEGVSEDAFQQMHGTSLESYRGKILEREISNGLLERVNGHIRLTRRGMDIQNSILVDLMDA